MQVAKAIGIQGIAGSFHHQVALEVFGKEVQLVGFQTFEGVAKAVNQGEADYGVIAIENSIAGAILPNYDLIDRFDLFISGEYYLPISHQLMALPGQKLEEIREVKSHPMALLQCKAFLDSHPHIKQVEGVDTATAAREIRDNQLLGQAAIASHIAAQIFGLEILAEGIQTVKDNYTRFILLSKESIPQRPEHNKASFKVTIQNQRGSLAKLLTAISEAGLNLSKIQSIPVMETPWEYAFFMDAEYDQPEQLRQVIDLVRGQFGEFKLFGSYSRKK
ncbi:prephenate dehydratase [Algoriphagus namhaensis]